MFNSNLPEPDLLKTLLEPLLDDFQHWFEQSRSLLESEDICFLGDEQQADLLARVKQAQQEVSTAQMLLKLTDGQVGVETAVLIPWHQLVTECWQVAVRLRLQRSSG
ncbi:DUF2605 domain-containing protein [Oscillatoria sp. FACHB-1407]|uniref:DUF2605 domain-containing protein n=1 Tax=Oscillatoria sp. FACHB-1407 TaxID=2692847 RepID=UPI00168363A6|nr:DUF2605 domain-containing protein [Oscillatoria sp. FACHB-1407]MBD2462658.1 DUF2605 domain-containing protein [Oscillatoria sp. FACHB-1407]